tara:strand:- start:141 stop:290 length:150 start_codon:yes stop_codon:yes gene_type:complete
MKQSEWEAQKRMKEEAQAEVKRLREENRSLFLRLSEVQEQLNAIHRGEE